MYLFYKLNEDKSVSTCSLEEFSKQMGDMMANKTKHVGHDRIDGKRISTVWLGIDHGFVQGKESNIPVLFETMVFDNERSGFEIYCDRYTSWDDAFKGHQKAVEWVKNGCKKDER